MAIKDLLIKIGIKGDKKAQGALKKTESSMDRLGSAAMKVGGIFFAAQGIVRGFSAVIRLAGEQQKAEAKLNAVLKSTAGVAGLTANELKNMASGLQEVTTFGDETILGAQSLLLTFTKIGEDVFPQATETILNMSAAMGTDLQSSTVQLGKALNDPITGISALSRVGVQLTDTQKEQIKTFTELGDIASAQKVILGELETQFGGLARATAETMAGSLDQMTNAVGDAGEAIGELLAPVVLSTAKAIKFLAEGVSNVIENFKDFGTVVDAVLLTPTQLAEKEFEKFSTTLGEKTQPQLLALNTELQNQAQSMLTVMGTIKGSQEEYDLLFEKLKLIEEALGGYDEVQRRLNETMIISNTIRRAETDLFAGFDENYSNFVAIKQVQLEQQETEAKNLARLIQQYPELAEKLGLVNDEQQKSKIFSDDNIKATQKWAFALNSAAQINRDKSHANALVAKRAAQLEVIVNTASAIMEAGVNIPMGIAMATLGAIQLGKIESAQFAQGGIVPGTGNQDTVPAMLTPGEVILNKAQQENLAGGMGGITVNVGKFIGSQENADELANIIENRSRLGFNRIATHA